MDNGAMEYEGALRYVFDRCGRGGGPGHVAEADIFRLATTTGEWSKVDKGLLLALQRIQEDTQAIQWTEEEAARGGVKPNFEIALERVSQALKNPADAVAVRTAIACLLHALKAVTLKASTVPDKYLGER